MMTMSTDSDDVGNDSMSIALPPSDRGSTPCRWRWGSPCLEARNARVLPNRADDASRVDAAGYFCACRDIRTIGARTEGRREQSGRLTLMPTKGVAVSTHNEHSSPKHIPGPDEPSVPELEDDETIPPRPEEEIADIARAKPDVEDHSRHPE